MNKRRTTIVRVVAILLAIIVAATLIIPTATSLLTVPAHAASISQLQNEASSLAQEKAELTKKLRELEAQQADATARKRALDEQVAVIQREVDSLTAIIEEYTLLIEEKQVELEETERKEAEQFELFRKRVRYMEEQGAVSYWSILFKADSIADLLARLDFVKEVMAYDQMVSQRLKELRESIAQAKVDLENYQEQQIQARAVLEESKAELEVQLEAANELVRQIEAQEAATNELLKQVEEEEESVLKEIERLNRELEGNGVNINSESGYIWPIPASHRVTSEFGTRWHPIQNRWKTHNGIDVGVATGNNVLAAKSGQVIISKYSSSYGNYVVISHGKNSTTLYAHMSSRKVSVGDYVSQGDVIGLSGNTGWSTGPHLHYEITENGVRVDPMSKY